MTLGDSCISVLHCISFFLFCLEEEEHAGVDSELDDSGSEVDEEQIEEEQLELRGKVMEKECPPCKGSATPPLASGNKGNQQPSACSREEEVLYTSYFTGNQNSSVKLSKVIGSKIRNELELQSG